MAKKAKAKASRKTARRAAKTTRRPASRKGRRAKPASKKKSATNNKKSPSKRTAGRAKRVAKARTPARPARARTTRAAAPTKPKAPARSQSTAASGSVSGKRPNLDRERRTIREDEMVPSPPSSLNMDRSASAARSGRAEFEHRLREHTSTGPALTGGDVDADWEDAEAVGEEAPGGDNPTPDQDVVDEIGRAMGIEYEDDEELQGGDELAERDRHRWELDPASKEDFEDE